MKEVILKNNKMLIIRELNPDDAEEVLKYTSSVGSETDFLTFGSEGVSYTIDQEKIFLRNTQETKRNYMIGGFLDDRLVSVVNIASSQKDRLSHKSDIGISVLKEFWNMGVGSSMMEFIISLCRKDNFRKIDLLVNEENERAIKLYEKYGFIKEGLLSRDIQIDGVFYSSYHMGLKLD